jgi:hypothetical protein
MFKIFSSDIYTYIYVCVCVCMYVCVCVCVCVLLGKGLTRLDIITAAFKTQV